MKSIFSVQVIVSVISGLFVLGGAVISAWSTHQTLAAQKEISKRQVESAKEVNQMQMNEKLILENRVAWDNETRSLISKLIEQLFSLNHVIEKADSVRQMLKMARDPKLPSSQRNKLLQLSDDEKHDLKAGMDGIDKTIGTVALIRLHLFDDTPNEKELWNKIMSIEQYMTKFEKIPSSELNELTEIARIYFQGNWGRLMMLNDSDNTVKRA